jgi:hypothetical protein
MGAIRLGRTRRQVNFSSVRGVNRCQLPYHHGEKPGGQGMPRRQLCYYSLPEHDLRRTAETPTPTRRFMSRPRGNRWYSVTFNSLGEKFR